jgi:DNA-binding FadR family transcriptional regulator
MYYDQLIRAQASAAEIASGRMSHRSLTALRESVEAACRLPADAGWERKAAAHAAFFTVLAEAANDPVVAPVLASGGELALEMMLKAGRAANGIVTNSRYRFLDCLRAGDPEGAALELEEHLRILQFMCRLAGARTSGKRRSARLARSVSVGPEPRGTRPPTRV